MRPFDLAAIALLAAALPACEETQLLCPDGTEKVGDTCPDSGTVPDATLDATVDGGDGGAACSPACSGSKPHCDASNECVACLNDAHCSGSTPKCDADGECVACLTSADCTDPAAARCDPTSNTCKACENNGQCPSNLSICDTSGSSGVCVECTGGDDSACGSFVCDSANKTCSSDQTPGSSNVCQPCISDPHCAAGQLCVVMTFGAPTTDLGHFCLWKQGTGTGEKADCINARPYVDTLDDATSIDGTVSDVCAPRLSTCKALEVDFSTTDCMTGDATGNAKCGVSGQEDAYCIDFTATTFRCSVPCSSDDDCPVGHDCATPAARPDIPGKVCEL